MSAAVVLGVLFFPIYAVLGALWGGYVLSVMWAWFMVPVFHVPALTVPAAIGVSLVMAMLTHQHPNDDHTISETYLHGISVTLVAPAVALLAGWIVQHWM